MLPATHRVLGNAVRSPLQPPRPGLPGQPLCKLLDVVVGARRHARGCLNPRILTGAEARLWVPLVVNAPALPALQAQSGHLWGSSPIQLVSMQREGLYAGSYIAACGRRVRGRRNVRTMLAAAPQATYYSRGQAVKRPICKRPHETHVLSRA